MSTRISVDVGGTFTDVVVLDEVSGAIHVAKVPTTPAAPEQGVIDGIRDSVPAELLRGARYFTHGTTVGLNALLERRGAVVGLLATEGFRDVLEIRRGDREEPYNIFWRQPVALVPRRLRLGVRERIQATGEVVTELVEEDVRAAVKVFAEAGVTAVAISFLNAYANPVHELAAEKVLRAAGFEGEVSLSHRITREYREYERTSTTTIDAFVRARMADYLERLETGLRGLGFTGTLLCTRSGGGAMTFAEAADRPFETILSGPVGAATGAGALHAFATAGDQITADVGGTSFDTCVVVEGRPSILYQGSVDGLPVLSEWVDVRSIGAGGGSVVAADNGLLKVGPRSAGADPGPVAYGKGGMEATLTDAGVVLGMFGERILASGVSLDRAAAERALRAVATALGLGVTDTATGVMQVASASMANTIRGITIEQGLDPREMTLVAVGGAGPLLGTMLADELDIPRVLVPPHAGNFSAWGLLGSDVTRTLGRTQILPLTVDSLDAVSQTAAEMFGTLHQEAANNPGGENTAEESEELILDLRYKGQEHSLSLEVPWRGDAVEISVEDLRAAFTAEYLRTFGVTLNDDVEVVNIRPTIRTQLPPLKAMQLESRDAGDDEPQVGDCHAYSMRGVGWRTFGVYERTLLKAGDQVHGPAIVNEVTTTSYIDEGWSAMVDQHGMLTISKES